MKSRLIVLTILAFAALVTLACDLSSVLGSATPQVLVVTATSVPASPTPMVIVVTATVPPASPTAPVVATATSEPTVVLITPAAPSASNTAPRPTATKPPAPTNTKPPVPTNTKPPAPTNTPAGPVLSPECVLQPGESGVLITNKYNGTMRFTIGGGDWGTHDYDIEGDGQPHCIKFPPGRYTFTAFIPGAGKASGEPFDYVAGVYRRITFSP